MATVLSRKPGGSGGGGAPSGPAGGSLGGTYPDPTIAAGAIGAPEIATGAVGTSELADGIVVLADGWTENTSTLTRTGNFTFTEAGDTTTKWTNGTRFKYTQSAVVEYGVVATSSHAAGTTTVTLATNTDYAMAAGTLDSPHYSYAVNPQGYPAVFNYTPTWTGSGSNPAIGDGTLAGSFSILGRVLTYRFVVVAGGTTTFGTGNYSWALPVNGAFFSEPHGTATLNDSGSVRTAVMFLATASTMQLRPTDSAATAVVAHNSPFTFGNGDNYQGSGTYLMAA